MFSLRFIRLFMIFQLCDLNPLVPLRNHFQFILKMIIALYQMVERMEVATQVTAGLPIVKLVILLVVMKTLLPFNHSK